MDDLAAFEAECEAEERAKTPYQVATEFVEWVVLAAKLPREWMSKPDAGDNGFRVGDPTDRRQRHVMLWPTGKSWEGEVVELIGDDLECVSSFYIDGDAEAPLSPRLAMALKRNLVG